VARDRRCGRIINGVSYLALGVLLLAVGIGAVVALMVPQVRTLEQLLVVGDKIWPVVLGRPLITCDQHYSRIFLLAGNNKFTWQQPGHARLWHVTK
jgi:hypothetical protein